MKKKDHEIIIEDDNYHLAPFANGGDFKSGDMDVSLLSPVVLATAVIHFIQTCSDLDQKENLWEQFRISVDGLKSDRLSIYVEESSGLLPLKEYLKKGQVKIGSSFFISNYFDYLSLNTSEAFEIDPVEFQNRVLPFYNGTLHAWPSHEYLKREYLNLSSREQKDLCHTMIDYLSTHIQEPHAKEKTEAYEWLKSIRKYKRLMVLGMVYPTTPNSVIIYNRRTLPANILAFDLTFDEVEKKLKTLLEGIMRLLESAILLIPDLAPYLKSNLEEFSNVYNNSPTDNSRIYETALQKLSLKSSHIRHYIFLEKCKQLSESRAFFGQPELEGSQNQYSTLYDTILNQIHEATDLALNR